MKNKIDIKYQTDGYPLKWAWCGQNKIDVPVSKVELLRITDNQLLVKMNTGIRGVIPNGYVGELQLREDTAFLDHFEETFNTYYAEPGYIATGYTGLWVYYTFLILKGKYKDTQEDILEIIKNGLTNYPLSLKIKQENGYTYEEVESFSDTLIRLNDSYNLKYLNFYFLSQLYKEQLNTKFYCKYYGEYQSCVFLYHHGYINIDGYSNVYPGIYSGYNEKHFILKKDHTIYLVELNWFNSKIIEHLDEK